MTDEGYVYLLWEGKMLMGVYLNLEDAETDAATDPRWRVEQWYVDTVPVTEP